LYYSDFCISLQISRFLEEQSRHFYSTPKTPRTYNLHTTFILRNITPNPSQKPCNFIYICKYDPFTPNNYFPLAILPNITRLLYLFSYISLSGTTTKTHFTPDFTKETPEKSKIDTLLRARALLLYNLLFSLLIRQNKTYLTSNLTPC
jgi:hypothetical protein